MSAARICPTCGTEVPGDFRFCGKCGARTDGTPPPVGSSGTGAKTMFFGANQVPGRAKLIVIKGEGVDGVSYQLAGSEHVAGRLEGAILFPDDPLMSPRHANFVYKDSRLLVRDEGSVNGIFMRIKAPTTIPSGGLFLIGEQLLQVEPSPPELGPQPDAEGTYFYASPKRPSKLKLVQRLRGGEIGMIYRARGDTITIGREGNDVNFLDDPFISGRHAQISIAADGQMTLTDLASKNGTFIRLGDETALSHGDYVFLGQQLLRVEIA
jgi:pSer/pThr/pTyr-binding forkhead associated (FHA) protein